MKIFYSRYFISFAALLNREILRFMRMGVQTLIAPFISNILFLGIFAGLFAGAADSLKRVEYIAFITPGLIISAVISSAYQNPVFSLVSMKYNDTIKEFNYFPIRPVMRMSAFILAGAVRGLLVGVMTYLAAGIFTGFEIQNAVLFWSAVFLIASVFATAGYLSGLYLTSFESSNFIVSLILMPLVYLGGVFFDTASLPHPLREAGSLNPLSVMIGGVRSLYSGAASEPAAHSVVITAASILLLFVISCRATVKGTGIRV